MTDDPARISPTAHYTGEVWRRHHLSPPAFGTRFGAGLFTATAPVIGILARLTRGVTLERMLLERHLLVDDLLAQAIETDGVSQVLELAAGMSGRGLRMLQRYGDRGLRYVETDLPGMVVRKRQALTRVRPRPGDAHQLAKLDAFTIKSPDSLEAVVRSHLDPDKPTAIISEGLLNYFPRSAVTELWTRLAALLATFPSGRYFCDLHVADETSAYWPTRLARRAIGLFARGHVYLHFDTAAVAHRELITAGFTQAELLRPQDHLDRIGLSPRTGPGIVRIVAARVGNASG